MIQRILFLVFVATAYAQLQDQYNSPGNQLQRTPSFLANRNLGRNNFGVHSQNQNDHQGFQHQNQAGQFRNTNLGQDSRNTIFNQLGRPGQSNPHRRNNQFSRLNQQQNILGRTQQFQTAEAGARVINARSENDGSGQYSFGYETDSGVTREETGQITGPNTYAVSGSYSYTSPEGVEVVVRYIADENGFQVDSPNVPAIPQHAQEQIEFAREAKLRGLIDQDGNPVGRQGNLRSLSGSQLQNTGLQNLVNQNRNFAASALDTPFNQQGFNSESRFSNAQRTAILRRPISNNLGVSRSDPFGQQQLLNREGFRQDFNQIGRTSTASFLSDNSRFGQNNPSFQNQISSRLSVEQGQNFRNPGLQASLLHGSDIPSGATGNVASYRIGS